MSTGCKETVTERTFKSWPFSKKFSYEKTDDGKVENVICIACSSNWENVEKEAKRRKLRGASLRNLKQYTEGVTYIHRSNLERHLTGACHLLAEKLLTADPEGPHAVEDATQPRIDRVIIDKSLDVFTRYFRTALWIALEELPLSKFSQAIELQRKNGLNIPPGKDSRHTGHEMVTILAQVVREDVRDLMKRCNFLSGISDGSEARKTREEKELVYVKLVCDGVPTILLLKCQRMIDFGGTDAVSLLKSIREAFMTYDVDISTDGRDIKKMTSMCADGASTNMGCKQGALTVLRNNVPWLIVIHCSLHKLELAMKDAFKASKDFEVIDSDLLNLFLTFKASGKCRRVLLLFAEKMDVGIRRFAKSSGTRFQSHKKNGLEVLLYNFGLLLLFAENAALTKGLLTPGMKNRFQGLHKKWLKYEYPVRVSFYKEVLSATTKLSLIIEKDDVMLPDIIDALEDCSDRLEDLLDERWRDLPEVMGSFKCTEDEDSVTMAVKSTSVPSTVSLKETTRLTDRQKAKMEKYLSVQVTSTHEFRLTDKNSGKQAITRIQSKLIPEIKKCIDSRFELLKTDPLLQSMRITDHMTWDYSDKDFGKSQIDKITSHFKDSLSALAFDPKSCQHEWKHLMKVARRKYPTIKDKKVFWSKIFSNEGSELRNILLVFEICLSIAWAQGMVERGFSLTRRLITDARTSLKNTTLDDLLIVKLNVMALSNLDVGYEEKLIKKAVSKYMTEKRRWSLGTSVKRKQKATSQTVQKHHKPSGDTPATTTSASLEDTVELASSSDEGEEMTRVDTPQPMPVDSESDTDTDSSLEYSGEDTDTSGCLVE